MTAPSENEEFSPSLSGLVDNPIGGGATTTDRAGRLSWLGRRELVKGLEGVGLLRLIVARLEFFRDGWAGIRCRKNMKQTNLGIQSLRETMGIRKGVCSCRGEVGRGQNGG